MCIVAISEIPIIEERKKERNKEWRTIAAMGNASGEC